MIPSHLKLDNFKGKGKKDCDGLCKVLIEACNMDLERLKKLPLPTFMMLLDYCKRQPKDKK